MIASEANGSNSLMSAESQALLGRRRGETAAFALTKKRVLIAARGFRRQLPGRFVTALNRGLADCDAKCSAKEQEVAPPAHERSRTSTGFPIRS